jgi:hypothetical protein
LEIFDPKLPFLDKKKDKMSKSKLGAARVTPGEKFSRSGSSWTQMPLTY